MMICGKQIEVDGRVLRIARVAEGYDFVDDPEAFLAGLRGASVPTDLFTFTQSLSQRSPKYSYEMEWDNLAALPVSTFDDWYRHQIKGKTRNMLRKAEKAGLVVREVPFDDELIRGIANINNESPVRQGMRYWHYNDDLETVRRKNGTFLARSVFMGAFLSGELIGYAKLVSDESGQQAGLMQILSMIKHRDKAPNNMLIAEAVRVCAERSIAYLWYAKFAYGKKQSDTLSDFKENNGFQRIEIPRYYIPLTFTGGLALRLRLHHGVKAHLPWAVLDNMRKLRNFWYSRGRLEPR